ncbi:MAG: transporter substrate-binding domain-containing protein [Spirochaetes bacterium]|nr:transporter substrate-binding domain-containing protein [Spirochaetota bacterium]
MKKGLLIYQKIILIQFAAILIITAILGIYLYGSTRAREISELAGQTDRLKDKIAYHLSIPLRNSDMNSCEEILMQEINNKYIHALVINQNNKFLNGKVKSVKGEIADIDDISGYRDSLNKSFAEKKAKIFFKDNEENREIGEIVLYITDEYVRATLSGLLWHIIIQTLSIIIILSIITYITLNLFLNKPLSSFRTFFERGASGDLEARYPVNENKKDEISELGIFFNQFVDEVRGVIEEVLEASDEMSVSSEELSATLMSFSTNSQSQAAASEEITATMEEISAGIDNVSDNTHYQFEKLNEFIKLMDSLSAAITEMAQMITGAQELSKNISERAGSGNKSLNLMNNSMSAITESSEKVSDIIGIIDDISNRINLLSLNAAIEAARAGEAGRGFAVVADEISKLADQTAESIKDIDSHIKKNNQEIESGTKNSQAAFESIMQIIEGVDSINNMMKTISANMEQQKSSNEVVNTSADELKIRSDEVRTATKEQQNAVSEIMKSITSINDIIQASSAGAEEMTANASRVAAVAENLKSKVSFFNSALTKETVNIISFEYPPILGASKLSPEGIEIEILKSALKKAGMNSTFELFPRAQSMEKFLSNESALYIGSLSSFDTETQAKLDAYPMATIRLVLFYLKKKFPKFSWKEYSELKKYTIGVSSAGIALSVSRQHDLKTDPDNDLNALFKKLESGTNDLTTAMDLAGWLIIDELFPGKKGKFRCDEKHPFSVATGEVIIFKNNPINNKVKAGLKGIYISGEWLGIMEKFYGKGKTPADAIRIMENFAGKSF